MPIPERILGQWLDQYPAADNAFAPRGYAAYVPTDHTLETGTVVGQRLVLATHPEFKPDGYIQGGFPVTLPPQGATVAATLEFISGARFGSGVDRVQVELWWFDSAGGTSPGKLLGQVGASDNGNATNLPGDLSLNGGQTGELRIIVRARANSGNDWLTWTQLTVVPKAPPPHPCNPPAAPASNWGRGSPRTTGPTYGHFV